MKLTQEYLKSILEYDTEIGKFRWLVAKARRNKVGQIAGSADYSTGYWLMMIDSKRYRLHTLVWLYHHGRFPAEVIDHIDGNPSNSLIGNLRECTRSENQKNRKMQSNNTSGYKGVVQDKVSGKWIASIQNKNKSEIIGRFNTKEEASNAYETKAKEMHGEFYRDTTKEKI